MRRIITTAIFINLTILVVSGCTGSRDDDDEFYGSREHRFMADRCDCRHRHRHMFMEKEFFDARDFHPDSVYGDNHAWRGDDYLAYHDGECSPYHKGRHRASHHRHLHHGIRGGEYEDAISERYLPPPEPDMKHEE